MKRASCPVHGRDEGAGEMRRLFPPARRGGRDTGKEGKPWGGFLWYTLGQGNIRTGDPRLFFCFVFGGWRNERSETGVL